MNKKVNIKTSMFSRRFCDFILFECVLIKKVGAVHNLKLTSINCEQGNLSLKKEKYLFYCKVDMYSNNLYLYDFTLCFRLYN